MLGKHVQVAEADSGSSPRAWGSAHVCLSTLLPLRSIPTCVGLGIASPWRSRTWAVHPHVRGARTVTFCLRLLIGGPSPRAWGSGRSPCRSARRSRSIPTCVGLGLDGERMGRWDTVHPHVRGARQRTAASKRRDIGPSPRAWGSDLVTDCPTVLGRSIPTCVGLGLPDLHKLSPLPICNQTHRGDPHARGNAITIRSEPHGESHPLRHLRTGTIGNTIYRSRTHKCPLKTNGCPTTSTPLEPDRNHHQTPRNRQLLSWNIPGVKSTIRKNSTSDRLTGVSHKNWTASPASSSKSPHRTPKPLTLRPTRGNNPRAHSTDQSDINPEIHTTPQTLPPGIPVVVFPKKSCPYSPVML